MYGLLNGADTNDLESEIKGHFCLLRVPKVKTHCAVPQQLGMKKCYNGD